MNLSIPVLISLQLTAFEIVIASSNPLFHLELRPKYLLYLLYSVDVNLKDDICGMLLQFYISPRNWINFYSSTCLWTLKNQIRISWGLIRECIEVVAWISFLFTHTSIQFPFKKHHKGKKTLKTLTLNKKRCQPCAFYLHK